DLVSFSGLSNPTRWIVTDAGGSGYMSTYALPSSFRRHAGSSPLISSPQRGSCTCGASPRGGPPLVEVADGGVVDDGPSLSPKLPPCPCVGVGVVDAAVPSGVTPLRILSSS